MPVGKTKDVGWNVGASRTFSCTIDHAWTVLTAGPGLKTWLGVDALPDPDDPRLRSLRPHDRVRLRWTVPGEDHETTVQLAVRASPRVARTSVRFHQEHLRDAEERTRMKAHWHQVLDALGPLLTT